MVISHPPSVSAILSAQQQTTPIPTAPITTIAPSITTIVLDQPPLIIQRVSELEKDVKELKQVDHSTTILASIRSQVPSVVNEYLGSQVSEIRKIGRELAKKQQMPKYLVKSSDKVSLDEYD
ncbi:hypothetical protein Tco_1024134 [Tanacetum coccineum]